MIHLRHRLALRLEPGHHLLGVHPQLDHLQRDAASHRLRLLSDIIHTATAFAHSLQQLVAPGAVLLQAMMILRKGDRTGF